MIQVKGGKGQSGQAEWQMVAGAESTMTRGAAPVFSLQLQANSPIQSVPSAHLSHPCRCERRGRGGHHLDSRGQVGTGQ